MNGGVRKGQPDFQCTASRRSSARLFAIGLPSVWLWGKDGREGWQVPRCGEGVLPSCSAGE